MYTKEFLLSIFDIKYYDWFDKYVEICFLYQKIKTDDIFFNYHHIIPVNVGKEQLNTKNRYHTISEHDKMYHPNDNVVKLSIDYHILAHYCLARATEREDDINSFYTLIGNYDKWYKSYSLDEVKKIAKLVKESSLPNTNDHYMTVEERKEYDKSKQKEYNEQYYEENKEEIEQKKLELQQKQKESLELYNENNKERIEKQKLENKQRQKEYYEENKDKIYEQKQNQKEQQKKYYEENKDRIEEQKRLMKEKQKEYLKKMKEKKL